MTEDTRSDSADNRGARRGPIGTVVGATLGPFGAAVGTVVDETRFALRLSVGTGAGGRGGSESAAGRATTIDIEDPRNADADRTSSSAADGALEDDDRTDGAARDPDSSDDIGSTD